ncbi:MAG: WD40 repeat domain-containing protein [Gemmataceae bacterium]
MPRLSNWFGGAARLAPVWKSALRAHVISLAWSPESRLVAAATVDGPTTVLDAETGATRQTLAGHESGTTAVAWVDEGTVATTGQDGCVRLWDVTSGTERVSLDAGAKWVERLAVSPCRTFLASAGGKKVRLWDRAGKLIQDYPDHTSTVTDLRWRPGCMELCSSAYGGVSVWSPSSAAAVRRFEWKGSVLALALSPDGKFLATGNQDSTIHFWVLATGEDFKMWGYPKKVKELAWDHRSQFLATGGGCRVTVWDCSGQGPEGTRPLPLDAHDKTGKVTALAFQWWGSLLVSGGDDGRVVLWRPQQGTRAIAEEKFSSGITQIAWSTDDRRFVVGTETGEILLAQP